MCFLYSISGIGSAWFPGLEQWWCSSLKMFLRTLPFQSHASRFSLNLAAEAETYTKISEVSTVLVFYFAVVNRHMPMCLKKFMRGSPPPFSSSFSLPLCLCFPYLVISVGFDYWGECGSCVAPVAVLCIFTVSAGISSPQSLLVSFGEVLRKRSVLAVLCSGAALFAIGTSRFLQSKWPNHLVSDQRKHEYLNILLSATQ